MGIILVTETGIELIGTERLANKKGHTFSKTASTNVPMAVYDSFCKNSQMLQNWFWHHIASANCLSKAITAQ